MRVRMNVIPRFLNRSNNHVCMVAVPLCCWFTFWQYDHHQLVAAILFIEYINKSSSTHYFPFQACVWNVSCVKKRLAKVRDIALLSNEDANEKAYHSCFGSLLTNLAHALVTLWLFRACTH